jgi:ABC-type antimicrobial peptide transport system permease subunit
MKNYDLLVLANKNLWRRKGRTVLTVLGVIIGTASIVVMLSLGIGLLDSQKKTMSQWGNLYIVRVNESYMWEQSNEQQKRLTEAAVDYFRSLDGVLAVSPGYNVWGEARFGKKTGGISLIGIDPQLMETLDFKVQAGRLLTGDDYFNVVAGSQVINNFWDAKQPMRWDAPPPQGDPLELLNQRLSMTVFNQMPQPQKRIYNLNVVGILDDRSGEWSWSVMAPIKEIKKIRDFQNKGRQENTMEFMEKMVDQPIRTGGGGVTQRTSRQEDQYNFVLIRTDDVADSRRISKELRDEGYEAYTIADQLEGVEQMARRIQAVLGGIGAVTLLVAAIGITNTMVMSIYERTREIAVMKVIGASFSDIRWLFLSESSLIGLIGGSFGIGLSYLLSHFLNKYGASFMNPGGGVMMGPQETVYISLIPPWLVIFAVLFSITIGLVSGIYPANRAIRLDPISAMRHF